MPEPGRTLVVKFGGSAFTPETVRPFARRLQSFQRAGDRLIIVHGGGKEITALLERLGKRSVFLDGLRVTDEETLEATEMVLSGRVNKALVRGLLAEGVRAVGIAGTDGALLVATPIAVQKTDATGRSFRVDYGYVGEVTEVHPALLESLLHSHWVPVVSPLATTTQGGLLNVNADTAAARIAGALGADLFLLLTDVPGVLVPGPGGDTPAPELTADRVRTLKSEGAIRGGMIPKVDACLEALARGARATRISGIGDFLTADQPTGTRIVPGGPHV